MVHELADLLGKIYLIGMDKKRRKAQVSLSVPKQMNYLRQVTIGNGSPSQRSNVEFAIREGRIADLSQLVGIEKESWGDAGATDEALTQRLLCVNGATIVAVDSKGNVCSFANTLRIASSSLGQSWTWEQVANEYKSDKKARNADILYGVNLATLKRDFARGAAKAVLQGVLARTIGFGCRRFVAGSRMPGYHQVSELVSAEEYLHIYQLSGQWYYLGHSNIVEALPSRKDWTPGFLSMNKGVVVSSPCRLELVTRGRHIDPELQFYRSCGLVGEAIGLREVVKDYFVDPQSCDYGVILEWKNPFWRNR